MHPTVHNRGKTSRWTLRGLADQRRAVSPLHLYAEPLLITLASVSMALACSLVLRDPASNRSDFYTFWDSGRAWLEGRDIYTGIRFRPDASLNLNTPAIALLYAPFAWLPVRAAFVAWTTVSLGCWALGSKWIADALGVRWLFVCCLIFISQATFLGLQLGQPTALLFVLFTRAWLADRSGHHWRAGTLLGALIVAKIFLGIFVLYGFWRQSRAMLIGMAVGAFAVLLAGLLGGGIGAYRSWLTVLQNVTWSAHLANISLLGTAARLLATPPSDVQIVPLIVAPALIRPIWIVCVLVVAAAAAHAIRRTDNVDRQWAVLFMAGLLISPLGWNYYVPVAAGSLAACYHQATGVSRWLIVGGYLAFCVPFTVMQFPWGILGTLTIASSCAWGGLLLFGGACMARSDSSWRRTATAVRPDTV